MSFARSSNILATSKYGLPVPVSSNQLVEEEDPLDAYMKEIEQMTKA